MEFYKTKMVLSCESKPTQVEMDRLAAERGLLSKTEKANLFRGEMGEKGENQVCDLIQKEGRPNWTLIRNLWLSDDGFFECDIVLITDYAVHTFEVKHYTGRFTYENGSCKIGSMTMTHDCIQQARKSFLKLQNICKKFNYRLNVKGSIIFSSSKNKVVINSPVENIDVLEMPDLYEYLKNIKREEDMHSQVPIDKQQLIEHLEKFEIENLYQPVAYSAEQMTNAFKGICCGMCRSFDVEHSKLFVHCKCGFHESREEAIVRSACEYGALTYNRNFSTGDICVFIGGQASTSYIQRILAKHFESVHKSSYSFYKNPGRDYPFTQKAYIYSKSAYQYVNHHPKYIKIFGME